MPYSKFNPQIKNSLCRIYSCKWIRKREMVIFKIKSNRFLHHMIRYLVGTMIGVCQGRISNKEFKLLLNNPKKDVQILKAPPHGLFLEKVYYE